MIFFLDIFIIILIRFNDIHCNKPALAIFKSKYYSFLLDCGVRKDS